MVEQKEAQIRLFSDTKQKRFTKAASTKSVQRTARVISQWHGVTSLGNNSSHIVWFNCWNHYHCHVIYEEVCVCMCVWRAVCKFHWEGSSTCTSTQRGDSSHGHLSLWGWRLIHKRNYWDLEINKLDQNMVYDRRLWRNLNHVADPA